MVASLKPSAAVATAPRAVGRSSLVIKNLKSALRFARFIVQSYPLMFYVRFLQRRKVYAPGRVTVITATYNRLERLGEAIQSVRDQTHADWEQIIVSDGPDARVRELVARLGDPRVRAFHTHGLHTKGNYQRNVALKYATGEFVIYLDDDNVLEPSALASMVSGFHSDEIGYVVCPIRYGETGIKRPALPFKVREVDLLNYMVRRSLVERVWGQCVHGVADFYLIDAVSRMSKGNFLDVVVGHHR